MTPYDFIPDLSTVLKLFLLSLGITALVVTGVVFLVGISIVRRADETSLAIGEDE